MLKKLNSRYIIIGLMVVQVLLCLPFIDSFSVSLDEPFSIYWAQHSWPDLMVMFQNENNPPLHFILLKFWISLFGDSAIAVRSLSLIFSILTILPLFKLGKKLTDTSGAILIVGLFIFNNFHHYYALEARTYSLLVFAFVWMFFELHKILFDSSKSFLGLAAANTIILYTHYLGVLIIGFELLLIVLFFRQSLKNLKVIGIAYVISLVLFIPGIRLLLIRITAFSIADSWVPSPHWTEIYGNLFRFLNGTIAAFILFGILGMGKLLLIKKGKLKNVLQPAYIFVMLFFVVAYFGMYFISVLYQPIFLDRYLIFTTIPLFLIIGIFVHQTIKMLEIKPSLGLIALVPILFFFQLKPDNNREDDVLIHFALDLAVSNNAQIIVAPPMYKPTFLYHSKTNEDEILTSNEEMNGVIFIYNSSEIGREVLQGSIVFIDAHSAFLYPDNGIEELLKSEKKLIENTVFAGDYSVKLFK